MWENAVDHLSMGQTEAEVKPLVIDEDRDPVDQLATDERTKQKLKAFMYRIDANHRRS